MNEFIVNGGIVGILLIMALKLVFEFVEKQKSKQLGTGPLTMERAEAIMQEGLRRQAEIKVQIDDLHEWHAPDASGEQSWKNARMIDVVEGVSDAVSSMAKVIDRLAPILEKLERKL